MDENELMRVSGVIQAAFEPTTLVPWRYFENRCGVNTDAWSDALGMTR